MPRGEIPSSELYRRRVGGIRQNGGKREANEVIRGGAVRARHGGEGYDRRYRRERGHGVIYGAQAQQLNIEQRSTTCEERG